MLKYNNLISQSLVRTGILLVCVFIFSGLLKAEEKAQKAEATTKTEILDPDAGIEPQIQGADMPSKPQAKKKGHRFTFKQSFSHTLESNLKDGGTGDVSISRAKTDIGYKRDLWEDGTLKAGFDYEYSDYDFSRPNAFNGTDIFGLQAKYSHKIDENWGAFGSVKSTWASANNKKSLSDGQYFNFSAGGSYALNQDLRFYLGLSFIERFEDDNKFKPLIGIIWKINERWKLKTANGFTIFYDVSEDNSTVFDFGARYDWRQYRVKDNSLPTGRNSSIVEKALVGFVGLTHKFNEHFSMRGFVEYNDTRKFEGRADGHDIGDIESKPTATLGLSLNLGF